MKPPTKPAGTGLKPNCFNPLPGSVAIWQLINFTLASRGNLLPIVGNVLPIVGNARINYNSDKHEILMLSVHFAIKSTTTTGTVFHNYR